MSAELVQYGCTLRWTLRCKCGRRVWYGYCVGGQWACRHCHHIRYPGNARREWRGRRRQAKAQALRDLHK